MVLSCSVMTVEHLWSAATSDATWCQPLSTDRRLRRWPMCSRLRPPTQRGRGGSRRIRPPGSMPARCSTLRQTSTRRRALWSCTQRCPPSTKPPLRRRRSACLQDLHALGESQDRQPLGAHADVASNKSAQDGPCAHGDKALNGSSFYISMRRSHQDGLPQVSDMRVWP